MMNFRPTKLFVVIAACAGVAYTVPVWAQTLKKEPDANQYRADRKFSLKTTVSGGSNFASYRQLSQYDTYG